MNSIASPLPWRLDEGNIVDARGWVVASAKDFTEADLDYMLRAVNANTALVEACEFALRIMDDGDTPCTARKIKDALALAKGPQ